MVIPEIIEAGILGLSYEIPVKHSALEGTRTRLYADNTLHARSGIVCYVDGEQTVISSADPDGYWVDVPGDRVGATILSLERPHYFHGTQQAVNQELSRLDPDAKYPFVWLMEPIQETYTGADGRAQASLRLFFLDNANYRDWTTEQHYELRIKGLRRLANHAFAKLKVGLVRGVSGVTSGTLINRAIWGVQASQTGQLSSAFNENLSGCELAFSGYFYCERPLYVPPVAPGPGPEPEPEPEPALGFPYTFPFTLA